MKRIQAWFIGRDTVKSAGIIVSGTAISQAIGLLASPILTRLYTVSQFGTFTIYLSSINFLSELICARYEATIVLPRSRIAAINLWVLCNIAGLLLSLLILLGAKPLLTTASQFGSIGTLAAFAVFIPPHALAVSFFKSSTYYLLRTHKNWSIAATRILIISLTVTFQVAFAMHFGASELGLIASVVLAQVVTSVIGTVLVLRDIIGNRSCITRNRILWGLKKYKKFPIFIGLFSLLDRGRAEIVPFSLALFYNMATVGAFGLAQRIANVPASLIGTAASQVFFRRFIEIRRQGGDGGDFVRKTFFTLFVVAIPFNLLILMFGEPGFAMVFGDEWRIAGKFASILVVANFAQFTISPLIAALGVINRQEINASWKVLAFSITGLAIFIGADLEPQKLLWLVVGASFLNYIIMLTILTKLMEIGWWRGLTER